MKTLSIGIMASSLIAGQAAAFDSQYAHVGAFREFSSQPASYAGVYLNLNLSGTPRSKSKMLSYGLRAGLQNTQNRMLQPAGLRERFGGVRMNGNGQYGLAKPINVDLFKVGFSENGFEKVGMMGAVMYAANGNETFWDGAANANDDGEGGKSTGWLIAGGVALGLVAIVALAANDISNDLRDLDLLDFD